MHRRRRRRPDAGSNPHPQNTGSNIQCSSFISLPFLSPTAYVLVQTLPVATAGGLNSKCRHLIL
uniref:Uncharacterized protein n=1 Tax=Arundo donax TaxID=35708 RepID=A0A0A9ETJ7_ARUDO